MPSRRAIRAARALVPLLAMSVAACDAVVPDAPEATPRDVFEDFWDGMDRYAGNLIARGVDWDSVRAVHESRFTPDLSDAEVFDRLTEVGYAVRDPHVRLISSEETFLTLDRLASDLGWERTFRETAVRDRLGASAREYADGRVLAGRIGRVGYVWVRDFKGGLNDTWFGELDVAVADLAGSEAWILDVRDNDGGNGIRSRDFAGRFAEAPRPYLVTQQRLGRDDDAFSEPYTHIVRPRGDTPVRGPVVVLTSRFTVSAAERFVLAMRERPAVTVVGDTTTGTLGGTHERELLNGWRYSLSFERVTDADGRSYAGRGIPPDVVQQQSPTGDAVLDRALDLLR
ncbi:MAG: S41 family peptidase [Bacteroidota bacterium]